MSEGARMRIPLREWRSERWERERYGKRPVIRRITQPTETKDIPGSTDILVRVFDRTPSGELYRVQPLYMLYVFRQNDQAVMIVNRVSPFQYEQMYLTDLEMDVVMGWAMGMVGDGIGRFTPADGGWMWWRK